MTRIHIAYRHIEAPWGGANNFIRALRSALQQRDGYVLTDSIDDDCDILFMNQLGRGPGSTQRGSWPLRYVRRLVDGSRKRMSGRARKLVVRAVNLNRHAFRMGPRNFISGRLADRNVINLLRMADLVIFQSAYQRRFFVEAGYDGNRDVIVHNGADPAFWSQGRPPSTVNNTLRLVSSTASPRDTKRHDLIAEISMIPGVRVKHFGAWPSKVGRANVECLGVKNRDEIVREFADSDYFLHPAIKDPCPNSVFEALSFGLPVIYNAGQGSSSEIVGENGIALEERNLPKTIDRARHSLLPLRTTVASNRAYYRLDRALQQYCEAFEKVARE